VSSLSRTLLLRGQKEHYVVRSISKEQISILLLFIHSQKSWAFESDLEFVGRTIAETRDKKLKEEALISAVFKIANALFVLGVKKKNTVIKSKRNK